VHGRVKWGAHNSHGMTNTLTYILIGFASFNLDNSDMMPMMHENARFEILSLF
jgi:hypothetical protein